MKIKFLLGWLCCVCFHVHAQTQDYNRYKPLKHQGNLPAEAILSPSVKYAKEAETINASSENKRVKDARRDFHLQSIFTIDQLMRSGMVLIEEEHSAYLREILHLLLKDEPALESKIRVYVVRSPSVNALALADGTILVNIGLLAHLDNEAQLAFVLAHEIAHIEKQHAIEIFLKNSNIKYGKDDRNLFKKSDGMDVKQLRRHMHSRENENEADNIGFQRFAKTAYKLQHIDRAFDKLKFAHLPFANIKFEKEFLEPRGVVIPNSYLSISKNITEVKGQDENDDDTTKTHPNLGKRRANIAGLVAKTGRAAEVGEDYLISQEKFLRLRKIAQFEIPLATLHSQAFAHTLYYAFLLSKLEKESQYVDKLRLKALYGYVKHFIVGAETERTMIAKKMGSLDTLISGEGETKQITHILYVNLATESQDACLLAFLYAQDLRKKYQDDQEIIKIYDDLQHTLAIYCEEFEDLKNIAADSLTPTNRIDFRKAVASLLEDQTFVKSYQDILAQKALDKKNERSIVRRYNKEMNRREKKGAKVGAKKVVAVAPRAISIGRKSIDFLASEERTKTIAQLLSQNSQALKLDLVVLDKTALERQDSEKLNDMTSLDEWFKEQNDLWLLNVWGYRQEEVEALAKKYGTPYFMWTGVFYAKGQGTTILVMLYNVETGEGIRIKRSRVPRKISNWLLDVHLYDALNQIKTSKSK